MSEYNWEKFDKNVDVKSLKEDVEKGSGRKV